MEIPKLEPRKVVEEPIELKKVANYVPFKEEFKDYTNVDPHKIKYEVDPIQDKVIKKKMAINPQYALVMRTNETVLFFTWIDKKLEMKENILIEIMGNVRSGKSIIGQSIMKYIGNLIGKPFTLDHICQNDSEYAKKIKEATDKKESYNTVWVVDEQIELHVQSSSYAEMELLQDLENITAINMAHICWIHPVEFVMRGATLGLETYGKNFEYGITRCIMYDLNKGANEPIGIVYIPRHRDFEFEKKYIDTIKMPQVEGFLSQDFDIRTNMRYQLALKLQMDEDFNAEDVKTKEQKIAVARKKIPFWLPESSVKEIVGLTQLNSERLMKLSGMEEKVEEVAKPTVISEETEEDLEKEYERKGRKNIKRKVRRLSGKSKTHRSRNKKSK